MISTLSTLLAFLLVPAATNAEMQMQCNQTINGRFYDLSPLKGLILTSFSTPHFQYYLNLCGTIEGPYINNTMICTNNTMICQVSNNKGTPIAYNNEIQPIWEETTNGVGGIGISITFNNAPHPPGYTCPTPYYTTMIDLPCDPTGMKQMTITTGACIHHITLPTILVCPEHTNATSNSPSPIHSSTTTEKISLHSGAYFGIGMSVGIALIVIICGLISYHKHRTRGAPIVTQRTNSEYSLQNDV